MLKSETIIELGSALAKAQGELSNASKSSANPFFKSKYADLAECINVVRPVFSAHGLSVTQMPSYEAGIVSVETMLIHSSGEWISSSISAPVGKQDAQGVGSAITYCRRYSLAAVAGIAQEDDDGNSAVGKTALVGKDDIASIKAALQKSAMTEKEFCAKANLTNLASMQLSRLAGALEFIKGEK